MTTVVSVHGPAAVDRCLPSALQSTMTEDNRRLSDTAVDILTHLVPDQGAEQEQIFSRDSLGITLLFVHPSMHPSIHPSMFHMVSLRLAEV